MSLPLIPYNGGVPVWDWSDCVLRSTLRFFGALLALTALASATTVAEPLPAEYYGRLPLIDSPSLSPDGSILAFFSPSKGRRCAFFRDIDQNKLLSVNCPQGEEEFVWLHWKSNKRVILALRGSTKSYYSLVETTHLVALNVDGTSSIDLVKPYQGTLIDYQTAGVVDFMDADPDNVLSKVYTSSPEFPDVIKVDIKSGDKETILKQQRKIAFWVGDGAGNVLWGGKIDDGQHRFEYRATPDQAFAPVPYAPILGPFVSPVALSDQSNEIYVKSNAETGRKAIYRFDLATGLIKDRLASRDDADIDGPLEHHGRLIGYEYTDDQTEQVFTDKVWQRDLA